MSDVECPYCGEWQDICHDDGYGYEEDRTFEQECSRCDKSFAFTTSIGFCYEAHKADCLNGGDHRLVPIVHYPSIYPDWVGCEDCDYEFRGEMVRECKS